MENILTHHYNNQFLNNYLGSDDLISLLINSIKDYAIFALDSHGNISSWNSGAQRIKLYSKDEIIGKHFSIFYPQEDIIDGKPQRELSEAVSAGRFEDEGWRIKKDGSRFWANVIITPIWDSDHHLKGFAKITRDMTAQKQIQDELKRSYDLLEIRIKERTLELQHFKDTLEFALDVAQMGIWEWDLKNSAMDWSPIMKKLFGLSSEETIISIDQFYGLIHREDRSKVKEHLNHSLSNSIDFNFEFRVVWPDQSIHHISAKGKTETLQDGSTVRIMGTAVNIDGQKRSQEDLEALIRLRTRELANAQAALIQSAKMSALGEMAGSIAHEINTPLASIIMKAQQLERFASRNPLIQSEIISVASSKIGETSKRIATIIRGLRSFAREGTSDPLEIIDVTKLIENILELCRSRFKHSGITIHTQRPSGPLLISCKVIPIEQVLLNLMNNAYDAIEEYSEKWVSINYFDEDPFIKIIITDSGNGISESILNRIMEPFFTTKSSHKGTGLGLSISKGIVEAHKGELYVNWENPHTSFIVKLPKNQSIGAP